MQEVAYPLEKQESTPKKKKKKKMYPGTFKELEVVKIEYLESFFTTICIKYMRNTL